MTMLHTFLISYLLFILYVNAEEVKTGITDLILKSITSNSNFTIDELNNLFLSKYIEGEDYKPNAATTHNILPPMWENIKELNIINYKRDEYGNFIVNVWDYMERMSLYKYLIENINHCAWDRLDTKAMKDEIIASKYKPGNILWGLPLQHGWQFSSNRLFNSENR